MTEFLEKLASQDITLVCFGEYVGFIHFGVDDHCRIEGEAVIVSNKGGEVALFPEPALGALPMVLGKKIESVRIDENFNILLENGHIVRATLSRGYESVTLKIDGQSRIF